MNATCYDVFASTHFGSHDETITTSTFLIDAAKIRFSSSVVMRFVTFAWIREKKVRENDIFILYPEIR